MQRVATRLRSATKRTLPPVVYAFDSFARADGVPGTAPSGQAWNRVAAPGDAIWQIVSNALKPTANGDGGQVWLDLTAGLNDVVISAMLSGTGGQLAIMGRRSSTSQFYYVAFPSVVSASQTLQIYKVVSGTHTSLGSVTTAASSGDTWGLSLKGSTIKALRNGATILTVTDSAIPTGTGCGFRHGNGSPNYNWDDFQVVPS